MRAISIGANLPPALRGDKAAATAITGPTIALAGAPGLETAFASMQSPGPDRSGLAGLVAATGGDLLAVKDQLDRLARAPAASVSGSAPGNVSTDLAGQLSIVAALINAGAPTGSIRSASRISTPMPARRANHERLLAQLDGAITGLLHALAASPSGRRAVMMTFSEFGRRPAENASGGTDHGAAAPLFVAGHAVKGGRFYGEQPSLTRLDRDGNQMYNIDFRSVYATALERVLEVDPVSVLGARFPTIPFV